MAVSIIKALVEPISEVLIAILDLRYRPRETKSLEVKAITPDMTLREITNYRARIKLCLNNGCSHFSDIFFKTQSTLCTLIHRVKG